MYLIIPTQYLNTTVRRYEAIYLFGNENKDEIKIGRGNEFYKYPIRKLINKKVRGYMCKNTIEKKTKNKLTKYRCQKCHAYSTNRNIVHHSICHEREVLIIYFVFLARANMTK